MTVDPNSNVPGARHLVALWLGLLLAPVAFLVNLEVAYALVPTACSAGTRLPVHLVHFVSLLIAVSGGLISWRYWNAEGRQLPANEAAAAARNRFMSGLGILTSGLFGLVILSQWIPSFLLSPCQ